MTVRGAPAIAIVAALALAVELENRLSVQSFSNRQEAISFIVDKLTYLEGSRPTAVNLFEASAKLRALVDSKRYATAVAVVEAYVDAARQMLIDDVTDNRAIGDY